MWWVWKKMIQGVLMPRVSDDPRSCQMDGHVISTHKGS